MRHTIKTSIVRGKETIPVEVEFTYYSASRGSRDKFGAPLEPDEPENIEIDKVIDMNTGDEIELTLIEESLLEAKCLDFVRRNQQFD